MLAAVAGIIVVLLLLGGGAAAVTAYVVLNPSEGGPEVETPSPDVGTTAPDPEPAGPEGCVVATEDPRTDVRRTPTKLATSGGAFQEITISGGIGFKADWDGQGECDVGSLPGGKYRTNVTPKDGSKIRGKSFEVVEGKKACSFTFDLASQEWIGGCK